MTSSSLLVKGTTAPLAEVFVNEAETTADKKGYFTARIALEEGENIVIVTANDSEGNSVEEEFTVTYGQ